MTGRFQQRVGIEKAIGATDKVTGLSTRELALPRLPELSKQNRARLQMQTPNRLFFYWSLGINPFQKLNRALGSQTASYTLVLKLVDLRRDRDVLHREPGRIEEHDLVGAGPSRLVMGVRPVIAGPRIGLCWGEHAPDRARPGCAGRLWPTAHR